MKRTIAKALAAVAFVSCFVIGLHAQVVVERGAWKQFRREHPPLSYEEISTPFVVRDIRGTISYGGGKPLKGAFVEIALGDDRTLGTDTDTKGWFELRSFRFIGPFVRGAAISPGTYRFKVTKDGFHSAVGTIIVSRKAPKQSAITIALIPGEGYQEEQAKRAPEEQLLPPSAAIPVVEVHKHKNFPEKSAIIYAPVSLAVGRVRTAEFPVEKHWYNIILQVDKSSLPFSELNCMLGGTLDNCGSTKPLLRADWTVWDSGQIVYWGSSEERSACIWTAKNIYACIGGFAGEPGRKYVVQLHFTEDGTQLNVTNPRLIVIKHRDMFGQ